MLWRGARFPLEVARGDLCRPALTPAVPQPAPNCMEPDPQLCLNGPASPDRARNEPAWITGGVVRAVDGNAGENSC